MSEVSTISGLVSGAIPGGDDAGADRLGNEPDNQLDELLGISKRTWIKIGVVAGLFICLFWPNLRRLWDKTNPFYGEANWGHAIAVPLISLYYLYVNREELLDPKSERRMGLSVRCIWMIVLAQLVLDMSLLWLWVFAPEYLKAGLVLALGSGLVTAIVFWTLRNKPVLGQVAGASAGWFGGYIMVFGIVLYAYGIYPGQNDFVKDFGMVVTLFGVTLMLGGWARMRTAWFAVWFLVCAIPWPGLVYSKVASPLQVTAAQVAVWVLEVTGVESSTSGTRIFMKGFNGQLRTLNVAEACAGLRSLMTFISVGGAVAFLSGRPLWQKIIVTLSAIPIAIFCNVMRVAGQGLLDRYVSQQLSESFAHQFVGLIMLVPAFLLILLVGWVLDQVFLEEVEKSRNQRSKSIVRKSVEIAVVPAAGIAAPLVPGRSLAASRGIGTKPVTGARHVGAATPPPSVRLAARDPKSGINKNNSAGVKPAKPGDVPAAGGHSVPPEAI